MDLWVDTDLSIELLDLTDDNGDPVTTATVEARVLEADKETPVTGVEWPVTLTHDVNGTYEGTIPNAAELIAKTFYWVEVTAVAGGLKTTWRQPEVAKDRPLDE